MAINSDVADWSATGSEDSGERAWLLQSPSVESIRQMEATRDRSGGVSAFGAVFIVVNAALGAGLLNFPAAFYMAGGVTAGVVLQMFMLTFIISGLVILAYCSQVSNESTYQEVVRASCGKVMGVICEVAIAVYTFGTCIAFFIVIGDQLDRLIAAMSHDPESVVSKTWYTDRKFTIVVTGVLVILPLSIPKEIGFQKYASALSVVGTWYVTIVVIVKYIWPDKEMTPGYIPTSPSSWTAVLNAIPTICFGFQCHVSSVPVFNSMSRSEIKPWGGVVTFGMIICLFVYTGTGVCGFLSFGSNVSQDVLMSYPPNDIAVAIARAFIVVCVVTSYPILHFCGRAVLEGLWLRFHGEQVELCVRREQRRRVLQTLLWFTVTLILALFIPDIGRVIALIGGLAACFIFVFPGLCLIQAKLSETENRSASWHGMVVYGVVMVTIGAFIFGQTTANAIYQDISNHS
ncbi:putative sodium-coupled neutral amino acid transporter 7 isoform X1 [Hypomesus transpacificus]|uniref:putative sodium-coupled neutral amino acid transporter 7 isoform X1 n=1 Tax=Hypomesus transpacificus TaxID=137520 RepID=UPI001F07D2B3|nr:putative sodium-coupled neutral amino acid transporter 7 isoform X1 [Hypomesus transpacificus]XP_046897330.1 putative sodium-coupled neutral amino acid transporter 7 isoform X1 [Hypomesus transpacificus]XP_046897331.1 putative sodium-coupled neutral amino acid transporter 7 isoform X1 [Hypomesus transpacificus]XP_046897332.1 putative sodium-coupled neutral amino acid transporter 7 isoform X1 [Hypomesus transpacificus]